MLLFYCRQIYRLTTLAQENALKSSKRAHKMGPNIAVGGRKTHKTDDMNSFFFACKG